MILVGARRGRADRATSIGKDLDNLIQELTRERPVLELSGAVADPVEVCEEFVDLACEHGLSSVEVIAVKVYQGLAPVDGMDEEELAEIVHAIVEVDGVGCDFTLHRLKPRGMPVIGSGESA